MNWNTIIPAALHVVPKNGIFTLSADVPVLCEQDYIAENFALLMAMDFELILKTRSGRPAAQLKAEYADAERPVIILEMSERLQTEEYFIRVSPSKLHIRAGGRAGFIHAYHTLAQYMLALPPAEDREQLYPIKGIEIADMPAVEWRGAMLDVSRHIFPVEFILHYLDLLALHHYNVFHWHLTDDQGWRIAIPGYPKLTEIGAWRDDMTTEHGRYGGFYTRQDIGRVIEHAYRRGISVVPEIDLPGHVSSAIAAYPHLSCRKEQLEVPVRHGIFKEVLCAGTPEVFPFIEAVVRHVCRLFPSDYLHLGGDECPTDRWEECPSCRAVMRQNEMETPLALQGYLMNHAARIAEEYDKRIIGWDEVLTVHPDFTPITAVWRDAAYVKDAVARNSKVILCPTQRGTYLDHKHIDDASEPGRLGVSTVKDVYSLNLYHDLTVEERSYILGGQGNLWTEEVKYGRQAEYMSFPRLSALAENLWLPCAHKKWSRFTKNLQPHLQRLERMGAQPYRGALE
ncbi:MAG: beta-N-acetylhexosaminidase [bacterium]